MAYVQKIGAIVQNKDMNSFSTLYFLRLLQKNIKYFLRKFLLYANALILNRNFY